MQLRTVYLWFSDPMVLRERDELVERLSEKVIDRMAMLAIRAADQLHAALGLPLDVESLSPEQLLDVTRLALDWMPRSRPQRRTRPNHGCDRVSTNRSARPS